MVKRGVSFSQLRKSLYQIVRVHENLVQHPSNNISIIVPYIPLPQSSGKWLREREQLFLASYHKLLSTDIICTIIRLKPVFLAPRCRRRRKLDIIRCQTQFFFEWMRTGSKPPVSNENVNSFMVYFSTLPWGECWNLGHHIPSFFSVLKNRHRLKCHV